VSSRIMQVKLSYSSILKLLPCALPAHDWSFWDGLPELSNIDCRPGRAGGFPVCNNISASNFGQAESALGARTVSMQARFSF
jgi:hypothetical protein